MRLCTIEHNQSNRACLLISGLLIDLTNLALVAGRFRLPHSHLPFPSTVVDAASRAYRGPLVECAEVAVRRREELSAVAREEGLDLFHDPKTVTWAPPVTAPRKIICVGLNYRDHAEEQNLKPPEEPIIFAKFANTLRGHREIIELPFISDKVDLEAELGFVIGKKATRISEAEAPEYILGYTIVNDVSARDLQKKDGQWLRAKSSDGFAPMGPCLVTPDEVPDPMGLNIESYLNDFRMQSSNTRNLIFNVYQLTAFISRSITLEPGDIISTGTPGGVGVFRNPPMFLKDGDVMTIRVEGLGELQNPVRRGN